MGKLRIVTIGCGLRTYDTIRYDRRD